MDKLSEFDRETLLQTILARLERNDKNGISLFEDQKNLFKIVDRPPTSGLVRYFMPQYQEGVDEYGNQITAHE